MARARTAVLEHPRSHLEPQYRYAIYRALETAPEDMPARPLVEWCREFRCALLGFHTARQLLPIWDSGQPNDDLPHRLVKATYEQLAKSRVSQEALSLLQFGEERLLHMATLNQGDKFQREVCVGLAACCGLRIALKREDPYIQMFETLPTGAACAESSIDFYCADAAHWTSIACASPVWAPYFDQEISRQYWLDWINDTIPKIYQAMPYKTAAPHN